MSKVRRGTIQLKQAQQPLIEQVQIQEGLPVENNLQNNGEVKTEDLFFANIYEVLLICIGITLSLAKDDITTLVYQVILQVLLMFSKVEMGKYVSVQMKMTLCTCVALFLTIIGKVIVVELLKDSINAEYSSYSHILNSFGFEFTQSQTGEYSFNYIRCVLFEILFLILNILLTYYYYSRKPKANCVEPIGYVDNSAWLRMYMTHYYLFFFLVVVDTVFARNLIQFVVLFFLIITMYLWAYGHRFKNVFLKYSLPWIIRVYLLQLILIELTSIPWSKQRMSQYENLRERGLFIGFVLNEHPFYEAVIHCFLITGILGFGQLYKSTYENYQTYRREKGDIISSDIMLKLSKNLLAKKDNFEEQQPDNKKFVSSNRQQTNQSVSSAQVHLDKAEIQKAKWQRNASKEKLFTLEKFREFYAPYVYIWICRLIMINYAYWYFGICGFVAVTWVLLSLFIPVYKFIKFTVYFLLPILSLQTLYWYLINITGFLIKEGQFTSDSNVFTYYCGVVFKFPNVEVGFLELLNFFFILLIPARRILKLQRDELRMALFQKCSSMQSNFLWQYLFFTLKYCHIPILLIIFVYGMQNINIFYIGVLFTFIIFSCSLKTYRRTGNFLIYYTAFFLYLTYVWIMVKDIEYFVENVNVTKVISIFVFSSNKPNEVIIPSNSTTTTTNTTTNQTPGGITNSSSTSNFTLIDETGLNEFFDYDVPYAKWAILIIYCFLAAINKLFRKDNIIKFKENKAHYQSSFTQYQSLGEEYEERVHETLTRKFPGSSHMLGRIFFIFQEVMILLILILQGLILMVQTPSVLFWGFLILALILQKVVISNTDNMYKLYGRGKLMSKILKYYSFFVIFIQVTYYFITDESFLSKYQIEDEIESFLGPIYNYLDFIGLESTSSTAVVVESLNSTSNSTLSSQVSSLNFSESTSQIQAKFYSQIAFYIMASILQDYFSNKYYKQKLEDDLKKRLRQDNENQIDTEQIDETINIKKNRDVKLEKIEELEDEDQEYSEENRQIKREFEKVRYTIPFMIYKRMDNWSIYGYIAQNFYLISATVTVVFCTNWQISIFMSFYLLCNIYLCIRGAQRLFINGSNFKQEENEVNIDQAHAINQDYMYKASETFFKSRVRCWNIQYYLLLISMIIMYPTPYLDRFRENNPQYEAGTSNVIFYFFWGGVYISSANINNFWIHAPYYILIIVLIMEKYAQRWVKSRFNCTYERITRFKHLEEKIRLIDELKLPPNPLDQNTYTNPIEKVQQNKNGFITVGQAKQQVNYIEAQYREDTMDRREARLKNILDEAISRKYVQKFRSGMKTAFEQLSLLLLLMSCVQKSNIISMFYIIVLCFFLFIKNKSKGMLYMTYTFGILLALQYFCNLVNLTSLSSPQEFPQIFNPYPNETYPEGYYFVPLYLKREFLRENLLWARFFMIDLEKGDINNIWWDFINLAILTVYFFYFGNPLTSNNVKVSFSSTKRLEAVLYEYSQIQITKKAHLKFAASNSHKVIQEQREGKHSHSEDFEQLEYDAADDSREYVLGSTSYLDELKQANFLYGFTVKSKYTLFIGWQLVTLVMIFLFAFLCRSFMSIGYLGFCIYLILKIEEIFQIEQLTSAGKKWLQPKLICGPIMIYSFIDVSLQIINQCPLIDDSSFTEWAGFEKVYTLKDFVTVTNTSGMSSVMDIAFYNNQTYFEQFMAGGLIIVNWQHLTFMSFKCLALFFIFLQCRIYESDAFYKFLKRDLRRLLALANNYKRQAITFRFNNWKLQKVIAYQKNRRRMMEGVAHLKLRIKTWAELVLGALHHKSHADSVRKLASKNIIPIMDSRSDELQAPLLSSPPPKTVTGQIQSQKQTQQFDQQQEEKQKQQQESAIYSSKDEEKKSPYTRIQRQEKKESEQSTKSQIKSSPSSKQQYLTKSQQEAEQKQQIQQQTPQPQLAPSTKKVTTTEKPRKSVGFATQQIQEKMTERLQKGFVEDMIIKEEAQFEKDEIFLSLRKKLPRMARFYLYLQDTYINKILFITDMEEASNIKKEMQNGKRKILCQFEKIMIADISLYYQRRKNELRDQPIVSPLKKKKDQLVHSKMEVSKKIEEEQHQLTSLPKVMEMLTFGSLLEMNFSAILMALVSNCDNLCYYMMIVAQMVSAGLVTILYPFAVFGYALMEEGRPGKKFWEVMLRYTIAVLILKFIFQLDIWNSVDGLAETYTSINNWILLGLWQCGSNAQLFWYIFPELSILLLIMGNMYQELLTGLYDNRETDYEDIVKARERYIRSTLGRKHDIASTTIMDKRQELYEQFDENAEEIDQYGYTFKERMEEMKEDIRQLRMQLQLEKQARKVQDYDDFIETRKAFDLQSNEIHQDYADQEKELQRSLSLIESNEKRFQKAFQIKTDRKNKKEKTFIKKNFESQAYFQRIFPKIKQQKPGIDLYISLTFVQFIICFFLIEYYTDIDTEGTQNLESSSMFSYHMVIVLLINIGVMILERYINRTHQRVIIKKIGAKENERGEHEVTEETIMMRMKQNYMTPKSLSMHIEKSKTSDTIMEAGIKRGDSGKLEVEEAPKVIIEQVRITPQQMTKFFLQWILLIIFHFLVFWYWPINSNYAIYSTPVCNVNSSSYAKYGCLSFHQNAALIIFYLLYCRYFQLSAMQIRHGLPEKIKGCSLQVDINKWSQYRWMLYYNLPFAIEIKAVLDWCFSRTALDVFQWLQIAVFQSEMYLAKCSGYFTFKKKYGEKTHWIEKCICGCLCLGLFFVVLIMPFIMFSNFGFLTDYNLVTDGTLAFSMKVKDIQLKESYDFSLYSSSHPLNIETIDQEFYTNHSFDIIPDTKFFDYDQIQLVLFQDSSETTWELSTSYKESLKKLLRRASNGSESVDITITLAYSFTRPGPSGSETTTGNFNVTFSPDDDVDKGIAKDFYNAINMNCSTDITNTSSIMLGEFLVTNIRLTEDTTTEAIEDFPKKNLTILYSCENFWSLLVDGTGIEFTTFSDLISSGFFSQSTILAFYVSVAYVVGTTFRSTFMYKGERVHVVDSPNTDALINLIDAIFVMRSESNIKKEEEYFHILIEVYRSPELMKHLCGSSLREPL